MNTVWKIMIVISYYYLFYMLHLSCSRDARACRATTVHRVSAVQSGGAETRGSAAFSQSESHLGEEG